MLKKVLTFAAAIVAVAGALIGNVNAKNLLVDEGWYRNADGTNPIGTDTALRECRDQTSETCAYFFEQGETQGERHTFTQGSL